MLNGLSEPGVEDLLMVASNYGLEAIRRLKAGFSIVYSENDADDSIIEEHPDGRRFEILIEQNNSFTKIRELSPRV